MRQLSAVELRKRVEHKSGFLWTSLDKSQRDEIKAKLPEVIVAEPQFVVFEIISVHIVHFFLENLFAILLPVLLLLSPLSSSRMALGPSFFLSSIVPARHRMLLTEKSVLISFSPSSRTSLQVSKNTSKISSNFLNSYYTILRVKKFRS